MSFFSDLFKGNFGNLGNDLNPSNVFSDFGGDAMKVLSNPLADAGIAAAVALPFLAPEILPGLFGGAAADLGGAAVGGATDFATLGEGGVTAADLAEGGTLTDAQIAALEGSPGANAFAATTGGDAFGGGGTALTMGGGGDLTVDQAIAAGAPAGAPGTAATAPGAAAVAASPSPFGAAPSVFDTGTSAIGFPGVTGGAVPAGVAGGGGGGFMDTLTGIGNFLGSPAGKAVGAGVGLAGLGVNMLGGLQQKKSLEAIQQQEQAQFQATQQLRQEALNAAQPMLASGTVLSSYIANNTLPQEFQTQLDQIVAAQKAQIRQGYASRNPGDAGAADPNKNSALAQDLASVDQQAMGLKAQIESQLASAGNQMVQTANQLLSQGLSATQLGSQIPIAMAKLNQDLNNQIMLAISNFSAALNGRGTFGNQGGITINTTTGAVQ